MLLSFSPQHVVHLYGGFPRARKGDHPLSGAQPFFTCSLYSARMELRIAM
jgi:hypothetical protein